MAMTKPTAKQQLQQDLAKIVNSILPTGWTLWKVGLGSRVDKLVEELADAIEKYADGRIEERLRRDPMSLKRILKGTAGIFSKNELQELLESGTQLKVKLGIDPTAPDLHLGHLVVLKKMRQFQDAGHIGFLVVGEFTALIGDPTGKDATRPMLSREEVQKNTDRFFEQAKKILRTDLGATRLTSNAGWLEDMSMRDFFDVAGNFTAQQLWHRDSFKKRASAGVEVNLREFLYPILQAVDSEAIGADVEIGGTDQTFNLQRTRDYQIKRGAKPQVIITMPLLKGLDGSQKMSKSLGNHVGITDEPNDMFGKIMSIPDHLMSSWFELLTDLSKDVLVAISFMHPKEQKERLAWEIVKDLHGKSAANKAKEEFNRVFSKGKLPSDIKTEHLGNGKHSLVNTMIQVGFAPSKTQARKLIEAGAVKLDGIKEQNVNLEIECDKPHILQVGKRQFCKLEI